MDFSSGYVLQPFHSICTNAFPCREPKRCHLEAAMKVNAHIMCIPKPHPVAAPFVSLCHA